MANPLFNIIYGSAKKQYLQLLDKIRDIPHYK